MNFADPVVGGIVGLALVGLVAYAVREHFSPEARERRRRRRSYGRITSRAHRPMVKLSVRARSTTAQT